MSAYEIIAIVFSSVALVTSIPAIFLSVRQYKKLSFKIDFRLDSASKIFLKKEQSGSWVGQTRFSIINKTDQVCTIKKILLTDDPKDFELYCILVNGSSVFQNIHLDGNQIISQVFFLSIKSLPKTALTFKIVTNRKVFTKRIPYQL